jgi:glycosyltransferase involved in cell wall biosynthesis
MATAPRASAKGSRRVVAQFSVFYPEYNFAGNSSTGIALAFADLPEVERVEVYCPTGSRLPPGADPARIRLHECWALNEPMSLVGALHRLGRDAPSWDALLFNMYVTSFGRNRIGNALGLLLPSLAAHLSHRRVTAYMHNFVETQKIEDLGYDVSPVVRAGVSRLERRLIRSVQVVVPLPSQRRVIEHAFGRAIRQCYLPYVDGIAALRSVPSDRPRKSPETGTGARVLLFGTWGPQKDLAGVARLLRTISESGAVESVTIAGGINLHHPASGGSVEEALRALAGVRVRRADPVGEEEMVPLFLEHDVLLLPYRTTGGYSGTLNAAAYTGIPVISYDLPQIREQAALLGYPVRFVSDGSAPELVAAIRESTSRPWARPTLAAMRTIVQDAQGAYSELARIVLDGAETPRVPGETDSVAP